MSIIVRFAPAYAFFEIAFKGGERSHREGSLTGRQIENSGHFERDCPLEA